MSASTRPLATTTCSSWTRTAAISSNLRRSGTVCTPASLRGHPTEAGSCLCAATRCRPRLIVRPGSIFVMNADGSNERRLTRGWLDALDDVDAHDCRGQRTVEPAVPVDVRPEPDRSPWTTTSNTPPTVSPAERASSMRAIIAASASGSGQRSGEASASSRDRVAFAGSTATPPTSAVNDQVSMPSSRRNARATPPAATRAAVSRADARSRTLRTSLKPYFRARPGRHGPAGPG